MASDDILNQVPPPADKRLNYGSDRNQFGELRLPSGSGSFPVIMNVHGGFWRAAYDLTHAGHLCAALTSKGFATWNLEYRRVGDKGGGWPGSLEDIAAGYRFLIKNAGQYNLAAEKLLVMGHSAGGQLALCLAAHEPRVDRVMALAGVVNLESAWQKHLSNDAVVEFLGGTPRQVPEHFKEADPYQLSIAKASQWLIHGVDDDIVPPELSRDYVARKKDRKEKAQLLEIKGADHYALIDPHSAAFPKIEETIIKMFNA